ncbi:MAG: hypothetical protein AUK50_07630 [Comamonadaceae bacterium CG2_30_57_122]|nr:MAG: hypothetical protein AUK50_07630 [Comamonadaceae bacterium CG2_30_57_122]
MSIQKTDVFSLMQVGHAWQPKTKRPPEGGLLKVNETLITWMQLLPAQQLQKRRLQERLQAQQQGLQMLQ